MLLILSGEDKSFLEQCRMAVQGELDDKTTKALADELREFIDDREATLTEREKERLDEVEIFIAMRSRLSAENTGPFELQEAEQVFSDLLTKAIDGTLDWDDD